MIVKYLPAVIVKADIVFDVSVCSDCCVSVSVSPTTRT